MNKFVVTIEDGQLVIRAQINNPLAMSKSGKSRLVATSNGNIPQAITIEGKPVVVSFNAYISNK